MVRHHFVSSVVDHGDRTLSAQDWRTKSVSPQVRSQSWKTAFESRTVWPDVNCGLIPPIARSRLVSFTLRPVVRSLRTPPSVVENPISSYRVALGALTPATARAIPDGALRRNGRKNVENAPPALFSRTFMEIVGLAVGAGLVSVRRAAALLDLNVEDLSDLFEVHGVARPANL